MDKDDWRQRVERGIHTVLKIHTYTDPPHNFTPDPQSNGLEIQLSRVSEEQKSGFGELGPQAHEHLSPPVRAFCPAPTPRNLDPVSNSQKVMG